MREKFAFLGDFLFRPKGLLVNNGGIHHYKRVLPDNVRELLLMDFKCRLTEPGTYQELISIEIANVILTKVFSECSELRTVIYDYVGNLNVDVCYYFESLSGEVVHRTSQLAHHDSVGHRLKVFIPLELGWITYYAPGTHMKNNFFQSSQGRQTRESLTEELSDKLVKLSLTFGDIVVFDTNGLHKGHVEGGYHGAILVYEFSNFFKRSWQGKVGRRRDL